MPAAEVDVPPELVRRLLAAQQPDLAHLAIDVIANGWDNVICQVGDDLVARLPRREVAARLLVNEQKWLPVLWPRLPLPIPAPVRIGRPGDGYPWPWSIVPLIPGEVASGSPPTDMHEAASSLGRFLGVLHRPAPSDAPANPWRGIPLADRRGLFEESIGLLAGTIDRSAVTRVWGSALAAPAWAGPRVWLHGDLHPANILVHDGRISGVIDFGDMTAGDPAIDLSVAWMLLPGEYHAEFKDAYREAGGYGADDQTWARARGWALALSIAFLAHSADNPQMSEIARTTLQAVLE